MLRRSLIPLAVLAVLAAAILPSRAGATVVQATGNGVTAQLSYSGTAPNYTDLQLQIAKGATRLYSGAVRDRACGNQCWPQTGAAQPAVMVAALDGPGSADVLLNLFSGGAHCCTIVHLFRPSAALGGRYVLSARYDFGDPGYRLERLDGAPRFVTADDRFAYTFTDFAASALPIQILRLEGVRFVDVTRRYPVLVRRDAARWALAYVDQQSTHWTDTVGLMAAWVADEATLGRYAQAMAYARTQARLGRLNSSVNATGGGTRFLSALNRFLHREGYVS